MTAKEKTTKARASLVLTAPFFASLALRMKLVADTTCDTMWVDGIITSDVPIVKIPFAPSGIVMTGYMHDLVTDESFHLFQRQGFNELGVIAHGDAIDPHGCTARVGNQLHFQGQAGKERGG